MLLTADADLHPLNSFALPARARYLARIESVADLHALRADDTLNSLPRLVLGGGSNLLFTCDFAGVVVQNRLLGLEVSEDDHAWHLHVGAGEDWHQLVFHALQQGWHGLENLALIPGTVGAAPVQNIGAYGCELADVCAYVEAFNWHTGEIERLDAAACQFGYRDSLFKRAYQHSHIITAVGFCLPKAWQPCAAYGPLAALGAQPSAADIFDTVCETRQAKLPNPALCGNAGSFFKNPLISAAQAAALVSAHPGMPTYPQADGQVKLAAGWLIDQCGLKGVSIGDAAVHQAQALVLVNLGQASAAEVIALAAHVRATVATRFGVTLEPEVRFIGAQGETNLDRVLACA
ncbi:MAG: UDP-N-acetylmuramate dehydrogenase [Aeromonas sp.]